MNPISLSEYYKKYVVWLRRRPWWSIAFLPNRDFAWSATRWYSWHSSLFSCTHFMRKVMRLNVLKSGELAVFSSDIVATTFSCLGRFFILIQQIVLILPYVCYRCVYRCLVLITSHSIKAVMILMSGLLWRFMENERLLVATICLREFV